MYKISAPNMAQQSGLDNGQLSAYEFQFVLHLSILFE
jgi:hypothetical protein